MAKKFKRKDGYKTITYFGFSTETIKGYNGTMKRMVKFDSRVKK